MQPKQIDYLIQFLLFLPILTIHESAHAWVAHKCGDDTAKDLGRISMNPIVHIDLIGTIIIPLIGLFAGGWFIGWGKPVPVDPDNFRRYRFHDNLVAMAGPISNVLLALAALVVMRIAHLLGGDLVAHTFLELAALSIYLAFFNMIPIPPLDGSHLLKNAIQLDEATYAQFRTFGFIALVLLLQVPGVGRTLAALTDATIRGLVVAVYLVPGGR